MCIRDRAFDPSGTQLAVSGYYEITIWRVSDGALVRRIAGLPERINSIAWEPRQNRIAVAGGSPGQWGTVALVNPSTDAQVRFLCDLSETALSIAFSPDGESLVACWRQRAVCRM